MTRSLAIVGAGPAGLHAAEVAARAGVAVTVYEARASVGRKFLVAGGGGLNITKDEPVERFATRYRGPGLPADLWAQMIADFGPPELRAWAAGLGIETFAASTGRVYPREMKAAPLLRRWVQRLRELGVQFATHHRLTSLRGRELTFTTPGGPVTVPADAIILALGGGSWPETGSDGAWVEILLRSGFAIHPLAPANCGWEIPWSPALLAEAEGQPLKNIVARAGDEQAAGELLITRYGLEGGALYQLGAALRAQSTPRLTVDLKPTSSIGQLVARLGPARRHLVAEARQRWRLGLAGGAMLAHHPDAASWDTPEKLATATKNLPLTLERPRPLAEAISSAGGLCWSEIDANLMLRRQPGLFVAGEMIDWEAPTGGYLMQGCFASGLRAARGALAYLAARDQIIND